MSKIAPSVFTGVAKDTLAAVDIYGAKTAEVKNEFLTTVGSFATKFGKLLGSQKSLLSNLTREILSDAPFNKQTALARLENVIRGSRGALDGLTKGFQENVLNVVGLEDLDAKSLSVTIGNVTRQIERGGATNALGIAKILDTMGNTKGLMKIVDTSAEASFMGDIYGEVVKWRIPEATDLVLGNSSEAARDRFLVKMAGTISDNADLDSIKGIVGKGSKAVGSLVEGAPDFAHRMVKNLKLDDAITPDLYPAKLQTLTETLDQVQPNWQSGSRADESTSRLNIFLDAGADAKKLFMSDDRYRDQAMIADNFAQLSKKELVATNYPHSALGK